jgi:cell division protein FtsI (penicillin-binding protein 3)
VADTPTKRAVPTAPAQAGARDWRITLKRRIALGAAILLLWSCGIEARLVYLQVVRHAALTARAERQQLRTLKAPAKRGEILDRHGHVLAYSVDAASVYAVPTEIEDPHAVVDALCGVFGDCTREERQDLVERLSRHKAFAYVRRQITPDQVKRIADLQLEGVGFLSENRRFYPNKTLAANVLGYVGLDSTGLGGIESTYDSLIKGKAGTVLVQTDAKRHAFSRIERPPTEGATLELTIDEYLEHIAERELRAGVEWAGAEGGSAIVMDPATGEILAMANYPTFNPNVYGDFKAEQRRNRAIQDLYEPGSTFKIVTASAALQEKLFTPDSPIDTNPGVIRFGSRVIDEDKHHNYGLQTLKGVIVHSSNVGAIKIGLKVGATRMSEYVKRFGFGRAESPDFTGENPGIVTPASRLTDSALASVSMGYQVAVTPLQMVTAASVVANGGELVVPRIVRAVIRDEQRQPVPHKVVGRVITPAVAAELTDIMEGVVTDGTGKKSQVAGYTVAGKTGTANKVENRRYSPTDYNVSFVGFVPSRQPAFAIVVVVDSPHKQPPYGGSVSAPIFQRIAEAALRYYAVPPTINPEPPILVARHDTSHEQPTSGPAEQPAIVTIGGASAASTFPDLTGLSARDALSTLSRLGVMARLLGTGLVTSQQPPAGTPLDTDLTATVWLGRQPPPPAAGDATP